MHESMKQPDTHEDLAIMLVTKWEYEDELKAIEEILSDARERNVAGKRTTLEKEDDIADLMVPGPGPANEKLEVQMSSRRARK